jgi:broad specificity phosphatase PhoE
MVKTGIIPQHAGTCISLVRHGRVQNPSHIFYGRLPGFPLSKKGRQEAAGTARALKNLEIEELFSSPLLRCRQTAIEILHYHPRLKLKQSRLITEVFTPYQGQPSDVVHSRGGDVYTGIGPEYEQPEDILKRVQTFFSRTRRTFSGKHVVAVTHGDVILFMLLWASNFPLTPYYKERFTTLGIMEAYPATSSITTFYYSTDNKDERPSLAYFNPAIHLSR